MSISSDQELADAIEDGSFEAFSPNCCIQLDCIEMLHSQDSAASAQHTLDSNSDPEEISGEYVHAGLAEETSTPEGTDSEGISQELTMGATSDTDSTTTATEAVVATMSISSDQELADAIADGSFEAFSPNCCIQLDCIEMLHSQDSAASAQHTLDSNSDPEEISGEYVHAGLAEETSTPEGTDTEGISQEPTMGATSDTDSTTTATEAVVAASKLQPSGTKTKATTYAEQQVWPLCAHEDLHAGGEDLRADSSHNDVMPRCKRRKKETGGLIDLTVKHIYIDLTLD